MLSIRYSVYAKKGKTVTPSRRLHAKGETSTLQTSKYINIIRKIYQSNRRAFCMRMRQLSLLKCHRSIFCELFTFTTSICRLFFGAEWRILGATFHKRVLQGIEVWKWVYCSLAVALERTVFPFVKQYIEDKMAAECSYDLTFRTFCAHFLSSRKRSVW